MNLRRVTSGERYRVNSGERQRPSGAGALKAVERVELTTLRKEVRILRMERDLLKKATAFVAKENA